ncbi:MAG: 16S rRNA (uracil(1498)-N(3))-methyltransferase [Pseudomarimonas sp.]
MRQTRCFVDVALAVDSEVELPEAASSHLLRVLRLDSGDEVSLFNGDGHDYAATLVRSGRHAARARLATRTSVQSESRLHTILVQGIARGEKMDLILQKATELGVSEIWPMYTERTEVKLDADRLRKRLGHWRGVIQSACEQCGRARIPLLTDPRNLSRVFAELPTDSVRLTLDPRGEYSLAALADPSPAGFSFAIGPEGGFSAIERDQLTAAGFKGMRLGPRILRTETAGLAAMAILQARFGDLV